MGGFWEEVRLASLRTGFGRDPALGQGMLWMTSQVLTGLFSVNLLEIFLWLFLWLCKMSRSFLLLISAELSTSL